MERKQIFGLIGSLLMFTGVFMPVLIFDGNTVNYFNVGDGIVILVLAVISFLLTMLGKYKALLITVVLALATMALTIILVLNRSDCAPKSPGGIILNDYFLGPPVCIRPDWGWAVLLLGLILLFVAAAIKNNNPDSYK